jgi:crotonobetainyl-CoA:carnitine CoA-transferase CaiB-like acyl-CoA transferase
MAPDGNHSPVHCPYSIYRCAGEDRWAAITVTDDGQWPALAEAIGRPDLASDPAFATALDRKRQEANVDELVEAWTSTLSPEEVQEVLIARGVPCHLVAESRDAVVDPQLLHRGHFVTVPHQEMGELVVENSRFQLSRTPAVIERAGPVYGQDNDYVLREILGLGEDEIIESAAAGAIE